MVKRVRILEKRVAQAAERLRELSAERAKLREELSASRAEREVSAIAPEDAATEGDGEEWNIRRREAVALIRDTLSELRAD